MFYFPQINVLPPIIDALERLIGLSSLSQLILLIGTLFSRVMAFITSYTYGFICKDHPHIILPIANTCLHELVLARGCPILATAPGHLPYLLAAPLLALHLLLHCFSWHGQQGSAADLDNFFLGVF